ncbi:zinc finger SWIM domain-containing protein 7-like [Brevipalpus obovatus]|uniref:zinc finger SWIM domain-containing protein 7-like n=1 Tax=Brevipalpus obovatus TaxID=246614 RepID=UPI003D9EB617
MSHLHKKFVIDNFEEMLEEIHVQRDPDNPETLSDHHLVTLSYWFGDVLESALRLIENKRIHLMESQNKRQIFYIQGGNDKSSYVCYRHVYFCSCPAFKHKVIDKNEYSMCKHLLASRLSYAMGTIEVQRHIEDRHIVEKLNQVVIASNQTQNAEEALDTSSESI